MVRSPNQPDHIADAGKMVAADETGAAGFPAADALSSGSATREDVDSAAPDLNARGAS
jgi:hypothetical protein